MVSALCRSSISCILVLSGDVDSYLLYLLYLQSTCLTNLSSPRGGPQIVIYTLRVTWNVERTCWSPRRPANLKVKVKMQEEQIIKEVNLYFKWKIKPVRTN